jgi:hypothetical protein
MAMSLIHSFNWIRDCTGMVIPVWFPPDVSDEVVHKTLHDTLSDSQHFVHPKNLCVVVDGDGRTTELVHTLQRKLLGVWGDLFDLQPLETNRGKHYAVMHGMGQLLKHPELSYLVVRDCDGSHLISDVAPLVSFAEHIFQTTKNPRILVIGRRHALEAPLGFERAELEELQSRVLMESVAMALAREGHLANLQFSCPHSNVVDTQSGFKVYGRQTALDIFVKLQPNFACLSEADYWRYGTETVSVVEALMSRAILGENARSAPCDQGPTSISRSIYLVHYGSAIAWIFTRLNVPQDAATQMLANASARLRLFHHPEGRQLLGNLQADVIKRLEAFRSEAAPSQ